MPKGMLRELQRTTGGCGSDSKPAPARGFFLSGRFRITRNARRWPMPPRKKRPSRKDRLGGIRLPAAAVFSVGAVVPESVSHAAGVHGVSAVDIEVQADLAVRKGTVKGADPLILHQHAGAPTGDAAAREAEETPRRLRCP